MRKTLATLLLALLAVTIAVFGLASCESVFESDSGKTSESTSVETPEESGSEPGESGSESTTTTYTITWMNGETELGTTEVEEDELPVYDGETPTKEADAQYTYTFSGWTPEIVAATENAIYTATFDGTLNTYDITFNSNGGSEVESQTVDYNTTATEPSAPTKEGYTFAGWQLSGVDYDFSETIVTGAITLDAVWSANEYTLSFTGGESAVDSITATYDSTISNLPAVPAKSGYYGVWKIDGVVVTSATVWNYTTDKTAAAVYCSLTDITFEEGVIYGVSTDQVSSVQLYDYSANTIPANSNGGNKAIVLTPNNYWPWIILNGDFTTGEAVVFNVYMSYTGNTLASDHVIGVSQADTQTITANSWQKIVVSVSEAANSVSIYFNYNDALTGIFNDYRIYVDNIGVYGKLSQLTYEEEYIPQTRTNDQVSSMRLYDYSEGTYTANINGGDTALLLKPNNGWPQAIFSYLTPNTQYRLEFLVYNPSCGCEYIWLVNNGNNMVVNPGGVGNWSTITFTTDNDGSANVVWEIGRSVSPNYAEAVILVDNLVPNVLDSENITFEEGIEYGYSITSKSYSYVYNYATNANGIASNSNGGAKALAICYNGSAFDGDLGHWIINPTITLTGLRANTDYTIQLYQHNPHLTQHNINDCYIIVNGNNTETGKGTLLENGLDNWCTLSFRTDENGQATLLFHMTAIIWEGFTDDGNYLQSVGVWIYLDNILINEN